MPTPPESGREEVLALLDLKQRFFGDVAAHDNTTEVTFLLDGHRYLREIAQEIEKTGPGDRAYMVDWFFDPALDLNGRTPDDADFIEFGDLLAQKAASGVDVRLVLNGAQYLGALGAPGYTTCYDAMVDLSARLPSRAKAPPLAGQVLYDWSGAELSGSQHQKAAVVLRGAQLTAFVGGIDVNPLMLDGPPHNSQLLPGVIPIPWGWHDGGVRLIGGAATDVYANFADRWQEAATLPRSYLWVRNPRGRLPRLVSYRPSQFTPVPPLAPLQGSNPTPETSVQVLRSRWRTKLNRPWRRLSWSTAGGGELTEVHATIARAIQGAQRYIYIEDQFLADHPTLPPAVHGIVWSLVDFLIGRGRLRGYSLFPHLQAALGRNVKVIMVGSGYADPGDLIPGPKNRRLNRQLATLAQVNPDAFAVWRAEDVTVHTKLIVVDDRFAAIGSANMQSRSMMGIDSELHVAIVSDGGLLEAFRASLWAEHLGLDYATVTTQLKKALDDVTVALGMWRRGWGPGGEVWFTPDNPPGFTPAVLTPGSLRTRMVRAYVGPGATP